jgi:hypothetical protein
MAILPPPTFADSGVIIAKFEKMSKDGHCSRNLRKAFDVRNIGR